MTIPRAVVRWRLIRGVRSGARSKWQTVAGLPTGSIRNNWLFGRGIAADTASTMSGTSVSRTRLRLLPLVLAVPLVFVPAVAYFALSAGSQGSRLPVAQGSTGNVFHPIAGQFVADATELTECGAEAVCLEQALGNIAYREGPQVALARFGELIETDPAVEKGCHRIAHFIGAASLERFHGDVAKTFSLGAATCVSGYYHGILERAFLGISSKAGLAQVARSICVDESIRRRGFLDYQCRHGLGHGLMIQTGYDLPLALSICAGLGRGWDHKACSSGVFMENINTQFGYRSPWLDDSDPLYPCGRVSPGDRRSCYLRASWRILSLNGWDYSGAAETCATLGSWASTCLQGLGRDVAEKARYAAPKILPLCRAVGSGQANCLLGAARTIANASGESGVAPAAALCRHAPRSARATCFQGVGLVVGMLRAAPVSRATLCRSQAAADWRACLSAANAEVDPSGRDSWG
jgi:hypothetical protein